jgi:hypothetical protein
MGEAKILMCQPSALSPQMVWQGNGGFYDQADAEGIVLFLIAHHSDEFGWV